MPDGLEVTPDEELAFTLTANEATPKATLTLKHPAGGSHSEPLAFKVKTTQPRRYLVRPNQGLIQPGGSETVQILMVEKDKIGLWQAFERLGQSGLDSSKDKFLVQSTRVTPEEELTSSDYENLTRFWTKVMSNTASYGVFNTKLPVKLVGVDEDGAGASATRAVVSPTTVNSKPMPKPVTSGKDPSSMSEDQLRSELTNLRGKYDELVSFSVNLTAERDILNNTLEQTKRDLNKYQHKSAANENRSNVGGGSGGGSSGSGSGGMRLSSWVIMALFWLAGVWMHQKGMTKFLKHVPGLKSVISVDATVVPEATKVESVIVQEDADEDDDDVTVEL